MKTTGIVRKIDELGRIVLPKELRKSLNINSGDDFQISIDENKIINSNESIKDNISKLIQERKLYISDKIIKNQISDSIIEEGKIVIYPIVFDSDLLGSLILVSNDNINNIVNNSKILNNLIKSIVSKE